MERDRLAADMKRLTGEYISLKNDAAEVEKVGRNVYDIMRKEARREQPQRAHDIEL